MAVRPILRMGHPALRKVADEVAVDFLSTEAFSHLVQDMADTLDAAGGIGLAATQIGVPLRVAIIRIDGGPTRYGELEPMPLTVFVNPQIDVLDKSTAGYWEGCLSVPGLRGFVERPQHIGVSYITQEGTPACIELQGFLATVMQHEFDHLDGRLYVDLVREPKLLAYEAEYEEFIAASAEPA